MTIRFSTFLCLFCLSASDLSLAEQSPYEIAGQLDHGYLLIRILASSSEKMPDLNSQVTAPVTS